MKKKNMKAINAWYAASTFFLKNLTPMGTVRKVITEEIAKDIPGWTPQDYICQADLTQYRIQYVHSLLSLEKGEVTDLEFEVIESMHQHELITKNVERTLEQKWTLGERFAHKNCNFWWKLVLLILFCNLF